MTTHLLHRLLPSPDTDALLGDIAEEARHRSRAWYWTQILAVVVVGSWRDVRRHPLLALRAVCIGVLAIFVVFLPAPTLLHVVRTLSEGGYYVGAYWLTLPPNAFKWLPSVVDPIGFAISGWTVARLHRSHGIAMVLPWTLLVCVLPVLTLNALLTDNLPTSRLIAPVVGGIISTFSLPCWVVFGGVFALRDPGRRNPRSQNHV
jgi:hypothetical protein